MKEHWTESGDLGSGTNPALSGAEKSGSLHISLFYFFGAYVPRPTDTLKYTQAVILHGQVCLILCWSLAPITVLGI